MAKKLQRENAQVQNSKVTKQQSDKMTDTLTKETSFDMVLEGLKGLAREAYTRGYEDCKSAQEFLISLSPAFANDKLFHDIFPIAPGMVTCERKIAEAKAQAI